MNLKRCDWCLSKIAENHMNREIDSLTNAHYSLVIVSLTKKRIFNEIGTQRITCKNKGWVKKRIGHANNVWSVTWEMHFCLNKIWMKIISKWKKLIVTLIVYWNPNRKNSRKIEILFPMRMERDDFSSRKYNY